MSHERPCCGQVCSCDGEDTWNDSEVCIVNEDDCGQCSAERNMDDMDDFPSMPEAGKNRAQDCPSRAAGGHP